MRRGTSLYSGYWVVTDELDVKDPGTQSAVKVTEYGYVPAGAVGVPLITPVVASRNRPGGKVPDDSVW